MNIENNKNLSTLNLENLKEVINLNIKNNNQLQNYIEFKKINLPVLNKYEDVIFMPFTSIKSGENLFLGGYFINNDVELEPNPGLPDNFESSSVLISTDNGDSWKEVENGKGNKFFKVDKNDNENSLCAYLFKSSNGKLFACGSVDRPENPTLYVSDDNGNTWNEVDIALNSSVNYIAESNNGNLVAVGQNNDKDRQIAYSNNKGTSWTIVGEDIGFKPISVVYNNLNGQDRFFITGGEVGDGLWYNTDNDLTN